MATEESATATLEATRLRLKAAAEPAPSDRPVPRAGGSSLRQVSLLDSFTEGIEQWWHKSTVGRAATVLGPMAEPYLRPLARRHYQALLLGSAAAGALVSHYPVRSVRTVLRVAGPLLLSSMIFEISKAGIRQMRGKPPPSISSSD